MIAALALLLSLLLGLAAAAMVAMQSQPRYTATSSFAVLPGTRATAESLGQLAFLTPVFAAQANDPVTKDEVQGALGRPPATTVAQTYPDSQLIFTITATGTDPKFVYATAQAFERQMIVRADQGKPVAKAQAGLMVVSHAALPTSAASLNAKVIYLAGAAAGLAVGVAIALAVLRRNRAAAHVDEN